MKNFSVSAFERFQAQMPKYRVILGACLEHAVQTAQF